MDTFAWFFGAGAFSARFIIQLLAQRKQQEVLSAFNFSWATKPS